MEFDPIDSEFDFSVDPITADERGLEIISKLDEGESLLGEDPELDAVINASTPKLAANFQRYQEYKAKRGESLFSYESEVLARKKALDDEKLARLSKDLISADEETFNSYIKENGDLDEFNANQAFISDKTVLQDDYKLNQLLKAAGYSQRKIDSGAAEPHMRKRLGADEESSEPTLNAFSRWGLQKINEVDRRSKLVTSATELATVRFLGMSEDRDAFEKDLASANPDLSDSERVELRSLRVATQAKLESRFKKIKPLVVEAYSALASKEGFKSDFIPEEGAEPREFWEIAKQIVKDVPEKQYPELVAMLAKTAEAHGSNPAKDMNTFSRGLFDSAERLGFNFSLSSFGHLGEAVSKAKKRRENGFFEKAQDVVGDLLGVGDKMRAIVDNADEVTGEINKLRKFYGELSKWQDAIVKTSEGSSGSLWQDLRDSPIETLKRDFIHGVGSSLPEMAAALTGPLGLSVIFQSKREENMQELRQINPDTSEAELQTVANTAALGYTGLSAFQGKILFGKMPATKLFTNKVLKGGSSFIGKLAAETAQESGQDAMLPLTQKLFKALDADIQDVNLFGEGGEINEIIKRAPSTAFASMPLILLGIGGSKAARHLDRRALERLIKNSDLLESSGFTQPQIQEIQNSDFEGSIQTIQEAYPAFLENAVDPVSNLKDAKGVSITPNGEGGGFSVSSAKGFAEVRTAEEAAVAVQQLDPDAVKEFQKTQTTPVVVNGIEVQRPTADANIDPDFNSEMVFHSFIAPGFGSTRSHFEAGESKSRVRDGLPPLPDSKTDQYTWRARKRFGFQQWFSQRDVPSKTLQKTLDEGTRLADGVEAQFNELAKSLDSRINNYVKRKPANLRDSTFKDVQADTYLAIRGDSKALARLPRKIRKAAEKSRKSIDVYSKGLVETGAVSGDLAEIVEGNLGSYVTREFKAYDPKSGWTYRNVKQQHPEIYNNAVNYLKSKEGISTKEADSAIREMLDPSKARGFVSGNSSIKKIDVKNLIQRKDLAQPIIELLGEVKNPAINVRNTGKIVSRIAITHATQAHMAEQLIAAKLASRVKNPDLRHTERLGGESFTGFGEIYLEPELAEHLKAYFEGAQTKETGFSKASDLLATVTGVGKFSQVILNPAAYPTNFLNGVATEVFNGRLSLDAKGVRAYVKRGSLRNREKSELYGVDDQRAFYGKSGAAFQKEGGVNTLGWAQLNTEMEQRGIRDNSVIAEDLNQTINRGFGVQAGKGVRVLSKGYQAPDNAIKRSAFVYELDLSVRANPELTMDAHVRNAAENVRMTTQNYDMVPDILRQFSQRGVLIPTYVSFTYEVFRTAINTARLAWREIFSGNPVLRRNGFKRVAGMLLTGALLYGLNELLSSAMSGITDEVREQIRALLPPWLEDSEVVVMNADGKTLSYFDPSYIISHQVFYNAVSRAVKQDNLTDSTKAFAKSILSPIGGLNIFHQTAAEVLTNKKRGGGPVYDAEIAANDFLGATPQIAKHFFDSMFTPGFIRTYDKWEKAREGQMGFAGSVATKGDIFAGLIGVRPYRIDVSSEAFLNDNLVEYASRSASAKGYTSKRKQESRSEEEQVKADLEVQKAQKRILGEFKLKIEAFRALGVSEERIKKAMKAVKIPRYMREAIKD